VRIQEDTDPREAEDTVPVATNWFDQFKVELEARHYQVVDAHYSGKKGFYLVEVPEVERTLSSNAITQRLEYFATHWFTNAFGDQVCPAVVGGLAGLAVYQRLIEVVPPVGVRESIDPEEFMSIAAAGFVDDERQRLIQFHDALVKAGCKVQTIHQWNWANPELPAQIQVLGEYGAVPDSVQADLQTLLSKVDIAPDNVRADFDEENYRARLLSLLAGSFYTILFYDAAKSIGMEVISGSARAAIGNPTWFTMNLYVKPLTEFVGTVSLKRMIWDEPAGGHPLAEAIEFGLGEVEHPGGQPAGSKMKIMRFLKPLSDAGYGVPYTHVSVNEQRDGKIVKMFIQLEGILGDNLAAAFEQRESGPDGAIERVSLEQEFARELTALLEAAGARIESAVYRYSSGGGGMFIHAVKLGVDDPIVDDKTVLGDENVINMVGP
jgi:hypothetical protein